MLDYLVNNRINNRPASFGALGTVGLQAENNLDASLVDLDGPSIISQLNRGLVGGENEALNLVKQSRAAFSNGSQPELLDRRPPYDQSCYVCSTDNDPSCEQVNQTRNAELVKRCAPNEPFCSVLRIEYRVSKEANWTLWTVERNCERTCEAICLQLGDYHLGIRKNR